MSTSNTTVPSRNALRVLRQLALAGSTIGGTCSVAAITCDVQRRVRAAERVIENKRTIHSSAPNYDATSAARRLARMMEAAESGEFTGLDSLKGEGWRRSSRCDPGSAYHNVESDERRPSQQAEGCDASESLSTIPSKQVSRMLLSGIPPKDTTPGFWLTGQSKHPHSPLQHQMQDSIIYHNQVAATTTEILSIETRQAQTASMAEREQESRSRSSANDDEGSLSNLDRTRNLLERGRAIEAAQLFLSTHPESLKGISSEMRELAVQVFLTNCKVGNVFIARSIFERLEAVDHVSPHMWKILIVALAKKGCIESVSALYLRYRNQIALPPYLIDVVLRSLLESHRLSVAKWLLYGSVKHDENCGLCGLFLHGIWKKTRNIELLNGQLSKLLSFLPRFGKKPTAKLFNPVLKAYVEFGRVADAEALVVDMQTKYGIPLSCRTKGLLVYSKALACDWDAVDHGLQEMHSLGFTANRIDFIRVFDRIFLEYWVSHSGSTIKDFIFRSVEKYGIVPDRVLYQHMLEALVEKGDMGIVSELIRFARSRHWNISINEESFVEMLRSRRLARERSPVGFWQMLQAARVKYGQSASSQQILGYDRRSVPIPEANLMPNTQSLIPWYERAMQDVLPSRPVDQFQPLDKQMVHFMHAGKMKEALKCFKSAKASQLQLKPIHVELAVIATLLEHGLMPARALIEEEWESIRDSIVFFPLFFRQVTEIERIAEHELVKTAVFRYYNLCWESPMLLVKHHLMVATSRRLMVQGKPDGALQLLTAAYISRWGRRDKFGGTCMKMFIRAFAETGKIKGVRWCILTSLARGSALNKDFVVEVRRVIAALKLQHKPMHKKRMKKREIYLAYLSYLGDLLERKCEGDPALYALRSCRPEKRLARKTQEWPVSDDSLRCDFASVRRTIESWDEEFELETLFGRINANPAVVAELWQETRVLGDDWPEGHTMSD